MKITITAHGVPTEQVRQLAVALYVHADEKPMVGCDGPEKWHVDTPELTPYQFARVVADLVKFDGVPISSVLNSTSKQQLQALGEGQ